MATNEEILVSAFQKKFPSDVNLSDMFSYGSKLTLGSKQFQNGHLAGILNSSNFCDIYITQKMLNSWTMNIKQNGMSHTRINHDKISH